MYLLYQTQKVRLAVSNSFSLQCVVLALVFLATLIFVNSIIIDALVINK